MALDRWNQSPLDLAIEFGHDLVAAALYARGGKLNFQQAKAMFFDSSRRGNIMLIKLLIQNGMDINIKEYDNCGALHLSAMADQVSIEATLFRLVTKC